MLSNTGFDLWADGYDKSVGLSDENDRYPLVFFNQRAQNFHPPAGQQFAFNVRIIKEKIPGRIQTDILI